MRLLTALLLVLALNLRLLAAEEEAAPQAAPDAAEAVPVEPESPAPEEPKPEAKPVLPLLLPCGQLLKITPERSVRMVDFDKLLAEGKLEAKPDASPEMITKDPASGDVFAVAEIRLQGKGVVRKTDFALRYGSETAACLALAEGVGGFDVRLWQVDEGTARLLFAVPEFTTVVFFEYAPELRVTLPASPEIAFGEQADAPVAPGEPGVAPPVPTEPAPAPKPAKPEPKPEPKKEEPKKPAPAKPEPKPEPKKEEPAGGGIPLF
jgi:outer membrane biosynthesis protein TonB